MLKLAASLACIAVLTGSVAAQADNVLPAETTLSKGQRVTSKNGLFHLIMQNDGNLVLYFGLWDPLKPLAFSTGTRNAGWYARMQADGNLAVYSNGRWAWQSGTGGHAWDMNYKLTLSEDGTLAIRLADSNGNGPVIKTLHTDYCPSAGGPAYVFPMRKYYGGTCVDSFTAPQQCGVAAQSNAFSLGGVLGRCSDNINIHGY